METCTDLQIGCASPVPLILSVAADGWWDGLLIVRFHSCEDDGGKYPNSKSKKTERLSDRRRI